MITPHDLTIEGKPAMPLLASLCSSAVMTRVTFGQAPARVLTDPAFMTAHCERIAATFPAPVNGTEIPVKHEQLVRIIGDTLDDLLKQEQWR